MTYEYDEEFEEEQEKELDEEFEEEDNENYCDNNCGQLLSELFEHEVIKLWGKTFCNTCAIEKSVYRCSHCKEKFRFQDYCSMCMKKCPYDIYKSVKKETLKAKKEHEKDCSKLSKCASCGYGDMSNN